MWAHKGHSLWGINKLYEQWGLGLSANVTVKWMYTVSLWRTSTMHTYLGAVVHSL
jgi:hypothetical protein